MARAELSLLQDDPAVAREFAEAAVALVDRLEPAHEVLVRIALAAVDPEARERDAVRVAGLLARLDGPTAAELAARWRKPRR